MRCLLLVLGLSSCVCFPSNQTHLKGVVVALDDPSAACLDVALAICTKGEQCRAPGWEHCWEYVAPPCKQIVGITAEEAVACSKAIDAMSCFDETPAVCKGIGQSKRIEESPILGMPPP